MAKDVLLVVKRACPHCDKAIEDMRELETAHPEFQDVDIEIVDEGEEPERIKGLEYYYVPSFFVDGQKIHEGKATPDEIIHVYEVALS